MKVILTLIAIVLIWWGEATGILLLTFCGAMCAIAAVIMIIKDNNENDKHNNATT